MINGVFKGYVFPYSSLPQRRQAGERTQLTCTFLRSVICYSSIHRNITTAFRWFHSELSEAFVESTVISHLQLWKEAGVWYSTRAGNFFLKQLSRLINKFCAVIWQMQTQAIIHSHCKIFYASNSALY